MAKKILISDQCNCFFLEREEKEFAEGLINYLITGDLPITDSAIWQDAEIFTRFLKRDVWTLDDERKRNAINALIAYRIKYVIQHLTKLEIIEILNEFFGSDGKKFLLGIFEKKFHASIDDLILTQEKRVVTKKDLVNFNKIFEYPQWIEFDDEALQIIFEKIQNNELTDEQISYFLGASDDMKNYDQWFTVAKHVLLTTNNPHTFWVAGDVLSIIWRAAPKDKKSQEWFNDQIFEIFWPRVNSVWPILNKDKIDFDEDDESEILGDAISWLEMLDDIEERLPELEGRYQAVRYSTDEENFRDTFARLVTLTKNSKASLDEILNAYFEIVDAATSEEDAGAVEDIAENEIIPLVEESKEKNTRKIIVLVRRGAKYAKNYAATLKRERENIAKKLIG
ncbi:hypothetical protein IJG27_04030 [Candidatus Saccharibacteria bacterium]|nr:hypothetical protein [Candidatus Saccharibacteria bacterium]MBQ6409650.1 hypothetical protein [Candidatus Saccharibacteria bacterium]